MKVVQEQKNISKCNLIRFYMILSFRDLKIRKKEGFSSREDNYFRKIANLVVLRRTRLWKNDIYKLFKNKNVLNQ